MPKKGKKPPTTSSEESSSRPSSSPEDTSSSQQSPATTSNESSSDATSSNNTSTESSSDAPRKQRKQKGKKNNKPEERKYTGGPPKKTPATPQQYRRLVAQGSSRSQILAIQDIEQQQEAIEAEDTMDLDLNDWKNFRALFTELLGTMLLTWGIVMSRGITPGGDVPAGGLVGVALVHAFTLAGLAAAFGAYSGGHFNPAVTTAFLVSREMNLFLGALYIVSQMCGGILGAGLALLTIGDSFGDNGERIFWAAPQLCNNCNHGQGFLAEFVATFLLVMVIFPAAVAGHAKAAYIAVGLALGAGVLAVGPITNACLNPARALGAAIFASPFSDSPKYDWDVIWFYLLAPLLAGAIAGVLFALVFQHPADKSTGHGRFKIPGSHRLKED